MTTMLLFIALMALSSHLAPYLNRPEIFFGVTVSAGFRTGPVARSVARRYAIEVWALALVAAALVITSPMPMVSGSMLLTQAAGACVAFVHGRGTVLPHAVAPATIREAEIGPRPGLPGGIAGQLGPFLILLAAAAYVAWHYPDVPARFPTHWNLAGKPDGWTTKSVAGVFRGVSAGLIICALTLFTSYAVLRWTRLPRVTGTIGRQSRRVRHVNLVAMLATEYLVASLLAWTSTVSLFSTAAGQSRLPLVFRVAPFMLLVAGGLAIRVMRRVAVAEGSPVGDTTPDSCWLFGKLYVNRADPALFVEKRMGMGYTLNLGNPASWLVVTVAVTALSIPLLLAP